VGARDCLSMLVVDAANVVGSRPDGWWRDRPGAARRLIERLRQSAAAGALDVPLVVVLEGQARRAAPEGTGDGVEVVHAAGSGDDAIVALVRVAAGGATVVSADRELRARVRRVGAHVVGPRWLLDRLDRPQPGV